MEVSQPLRSRRGVVLNDCFASVCQGVVRIRAGRKLEIHQFHDTSSEWSIRWKNACHYLGDLITPGSPTGHVVDLNRGSFEALPSGIVVNRFRTQEQGVAAGTRGSLAVPTARGEETDSIC